MQFLFGAHSYAGTTEEYSLWIEQARPNIFYINYGVFPEKSAQGPDKIEAFYTIGEKDGSGQDVYYKLDIKTGPSGPEVRIDPANGVWCSVLARAVKKYDNIDYEYTARAAYFIAPGDNPGPVNTGTRFQLKDDGGFDIRIFRDKASGHLRDRWFPVRAQIIFKDKPLRNAKAMITNAWGDREDFITDNSGNLVYIPRYPERAKSFNTLSDCDLLTVSRMSGGTVLKASYALVFKRPGPSDRHFNVQMGVTIFLLSALATFLAFKRWGKENRP